MRQKQRHWHRECVQQKNLTTTTKPSATATTTHAQKKCTLKWMESVTGNKQIKIQQNWERFCANEFVLFLF